MTPWPKSYIERIATLETLDDIEGYKLGREVFADIHGQDKRWRDGELAALTQREDEIRRKTGRQRPGAAHTAAS